MHKTDILWAKPSNGGEADQFGKSSPKLRKIFILCNYIKKSTVCQRFYPAKAIAQNFCNYIFYYTKKQPISRLFFVFFYMLNSHFIICFSP